MSEPECQSILICDAIIELENAVAISDDTVVKTILTRSLEKLKRVIPERDVEMRKFILDQEL